MRSKDVRVPLRQFLLFGIIGCVGFLVDATVLYALVRRLGLDAFASRGASYLAAATSTWVLNRRLTFSASRSDSIGREWMKFVLFNVAGGVVNYCVYAAYVKFHGTTPLALVIGVAAGSLSGMTVNFLVSRHFVFTGPLRSGAISGREDGEPR